jgi:hypothetical protein
MIVKPDFVSNHYKQHQSQDNLILSGTMYYKLVYTSIFPSFTSGQIKKVESLVQKNPLLDQRYKKYDPNSTDIFTLNEKEEIGSELVEDLTIGTSNWFQIIIDNFGPELEGFNFPWMSFLTGNVSLKKELIIKARLFDEDFVHYGYEDWELGYRLNKLGGKYLQSEEIIAYHQEHPIGPDKWKEAIENFQLFKQKHPDVDVLILGLELAQITDLLTMNNVLGEYKHLVETFPDEFLLFKQNFIEILETIITLLNIDIRHINILGVAGFGTDQKYNLLRETVQIYHLGMYQNLTNTVLKIMYS